MRQPAFRPSSADPAISARAHKADEWIGIDELAASDRMMQRLALQLGKPAEEWI